MALIPTYTRSKGLPATTGVEDAPVTTISAAATDKADGFFKQLGAYGDFVTKQQTDTETAVANAALSTGMAQIEAELAKEDGLVAPTLFDAKAEALYNKAAAGLTTADGQLALTRAFPGFAGKSKINVTSTGLIRKHTALEADLITVTDASVNLIAKGMPPHIRAAIQKGVMDSVDRAVKSNTISPVAGANRKIKLRGDIAKNGIAAWVNGTTKGGLIDVYDQMDSGVFTGSDSKQNEADWKALTEIEKQSIRQGVSRELESLQRLRDKEDRAEEKKAKVGQEDMFGSIAGLIQAISTGEHGDKNDMPALSDLEKLKKQRKITGKQQKILGEMIKSETQAKTTPASLLSLSNDIYAVSYLPADQQKDAMTEINARIFALSSEGGLEAAHGTQLKGLMDKVLERNSKHTPRVRARVSLNNILGGVDAQYKIPGYNADPQEQARIQQTLNEYDVRVDEGENPWDLHKELLVRSSVEMPSVKSLPRPIRGPAIELDKWTAGDVETATADMVEALSKNMITHGAFNASMGYLATLSAIISRKELLLDQSNKTPEQRQDDSKAEIKRRKP